MKYIGIGENRGFEVNEQDALCYAMQHCGIQISKPTAETKSFLDMLIKWYFSGNWLTESDTDNEW